MLALFEDVAVVAAAAVSLFLPLLDDQRADIVASYAQI